MSFTNLYYRRTAGTAKSCFVCYKPTTTVLATINTVDFLYTCPGHLTDPGFATLVNTSDMPKVAISAEEIAKVKAEWEEKEKKRKEKAKEKEEKEKAKEKEEKEKAKEKEEKEKAKEKEEKEKEKEKEKDSDNKTGDKEKEGSKSPKIPAASSTPPPAHERYTLHRNFFSMRQDEHRRRRQATQAKELAPRFPAAPRGEVEKY